MGDIIDKANADHERWLMGQIELASKASAKSAPNAVMNCVDCDKPIGEGRKRAMPSAVRCVACQSEHETGGYKQRKGR